MLVVNGRPVGVSDKPYDPTKPDCKLANCNDANDRFGGTVNFGNRTSGSVFDVLQQVVNPGPNR